MIRNVSIPIISHQKAESHRLGCLRYSTISPWIKYLGPCQLRQLWLVRELPLANNLCLHNCCHLTGSMPHKKKTDTHARTHARTHTHTLTQAHKTVTESAKKHVQVVLRNSLLVPLGISKHAILENISQLLSFQLPGIGMALLFGVVHVAHCFFSRCTCTWNVH